MKTNKNVQRNTINEARVKMSDIQKSGINLSYTSQTSGGIGKLIPTSVQWIMAGDKFSGSNTINAQFEPLAVPMSGRLKIESHNFFVRMRNIYRDWDDFMLFNQGLPDVTKLPTFTLQSIFSYLQENSLPSILPFSSTAAKETWSNVLAFISSVQSLSDFTTEDFFIEYRDTMLNFIAANNPNNITSADAYHDFSTSLFSLMLGKLVGEGSYLDYFGYPIMDNSSIRKLVLKATAQNKVLTFDKEVSNVPMTDAPIRAFYYIWYAYYRNIYTEPKKRCINPRSFTSAPLPIETLFKLLIPRFRNWDIDMFTGAQTDDLSRHVNVLVPDPITPGSASQIGPSMQYNANADNYEPVDSGWMAEMQQEGITSQTIHWITTDGESRQTTVPVPTIFASAFVAGNGTIINTAKGSGSSMTNAVQNMPLLQLKRTQMLEKYLKRCFYSGDLYQDYMRGIYGTDVSDAISNVPEYLDGGSSTPCQVDQQINNTSTEYSPAGTKTAVISANSGGDSFTKFADEFGLYFNIMSFLPECAYDGMPNQLLYSELMDFPIPQFSQQDDEHSHRFELKRTALLQEQTIAFRPFAHHPYKHDWRSRTNDMHGNALSSRKAYNFGRLFDYESESTTPKLNASFLHCKPDLDMFISSSPLNDVWFGYIDHQFYVERALSAYVEEI